MANEILKRDENRITVLGAVTDDANQFITQLRVNPTNNRLKVSAVISSGGGINSINGLTAGAQFITTGTFGTNFNIVSSVDTTTLNIPTASATNRGLLSAADWTTFTNASTANGTVTSVSVVGANGFYGTVANPTTTPAITLNTTITGVLKGSGNALVAAVAGGDFTAGTSVLATGLLKNTTGTGAITIALNSDLPVMTATVGGAVPTPPNNTTTFLRGDGTFNTPATGSGTVTTVSVVSANGLGGTVANATTTPAITLTTSVVGIALGNGTSFIAATTTGVGNVVVLQNSPTFTNTPAAPTAGPGTSTTQLATTEFVQVAVRSSPGKEASEFATTAALPTVTYNNGTAGVGATLTGVGLGAITLDGNTPIVGNRLLVKNQVSTFQNGIYTVTIVGTAGTVFVLTRALDFNQQTDILTGAATYVVGGTTLAGTTWDVNSADSPVIGTDAITFVQSAGPGSVVQGNGITITGTSIAINTAVTADLSSTQTLTNKTIDGVTPTVMGYVDPTSSIQTQLNAKGVGTWTDSSTSTGSNKTFVAPALGTPASGVMTNMTGLPAAAILPGTLVAGTYLLAENASLGLDPAGSADGKYTGITITGTAGATIAFGDVIVLDVTASKWLLADANSAAAADGDARGLIGMCVLAANDTGATVILLHGTCRADANFPALTITAPVYLSETPGDIVVAQPTTTDAVIRVMGFALTADEIYFNPSSDYMTHI